MSRNSSLPCPQCGLSTSGVVDSRGMTDAIRRRRKCVNGHRFTTYETLAAARVQDDPVLIGLDDLEGKLIEGIRSLRRARLSPVDREA